MATSLRILQSQMSSLDWPTTNTPVISNRIVAISRRNAFICIYSNFWPKIGCDSNAHLSLVRGSITDEFPNGTNPTSKPNSAWICHILLKLWPLLWDFCLFRPKFGCHGDVPETLESGIYSLAWPTTTTPVINRLNRVLIISRRNVFIAILVPELLAMVTPLCFLRTRVW